jgi:plasmid stability protein
MQTVIIKNMPETLFANLQFSAKAHNRSVNSEIIACLERETPIEVPSMEKKLADIRAFRDQFPPLNLDQDEIRGAINEGRP